jgi:hypothetical protein
MLFLTMMVEYRTTAGQRVIVIGGTQLASLRDWLAALDLGTLKAREGGAAALLLDFRAQGFTPGAREANALVSTLVALCADRIPPVAILTNPGAQYGGARMLCTLGELRACHAAAFRDEATAWEWLGGQLQGLPRSRRVAAPTPVALQA